jgi:hypothetical protein
LIAVLLLCALLGGCDGDDDDFDVLTDQLLLPVALCTALHVNALARFLGRLQELFDVINGAPLPPGFIENTPLSSYTFTLDFELDGTPDITVDLSIVPDFNDISDGLQPGESIVMNVTFTGDISGVGESKLAFGTQQGIPILGVTRSFDLTDGGTCTFATIGFNASWVVGDLDTLSPNFSFTSTENGMVLNANLFLEGDFLLVVGELDGVSVGFAIDPEFFNVFED